jgi:hypothetical protein
MGAARVTGRGVVHVSADGLTVEGTIFGAGPQISPWASLLVLLCGLCISVFVPHAERVLTPATVLVVGGIVWLRYRSEFGQSGTFAVRWPEVEHVVRLASSPDVLAVVLSRPLGGRGSPEQVFFAPAGGVESMVEAIREFAPSTLTMDVDSGLRPSPASQPDEGTELWP